MQNENEKEHENDLFVSGASRDFPLSVYIKFDPRFNEKPSQIQGNVISYMAGCVCRTVMKSHKCVGCRRDEGNRLI